MRWLGIALICEGTSDDLFLPDVLRRSAQEVCGPDVDVPDPVIVRASSGPANRSQALGRLEELDGAFNLVAYHRDGHRPDQEIERWVQPFRKALALDRGEPVVAVIPVRETEAWAMADGDALRYVLGVEWSERLALPGTGRALGAVEDPKRLLRNIVDEVTSWNVDYLNRLGEAVSLARLRDLPAFRRWENDLAEALHALPGFADR